MLAATALAVAESAPASELGKMVNAFFANPYTLFGAGMALLILFFMYFATEIEKNKRNIGTVLFLGVVALCLFSAIPPKERLKGGIDILGGSSFTLKIQERKDDDGNLIPVSTEQAETAVKVIRGRLDEFGGKDAFVAVVGDNNVGVQMPGVTPEEAASIEAILEKVAKLDLHAVHRDSDAQGPEGKTLAQRVMDGDEIVPGYAAYEYQYKDENGTEITRAILLNRRPALGGNDISRANPSMSQQDAVEITLNGEGANKMIALTTPMQPGQDRIAIVLDGKVKSAPVVRSVPLGRNFIIEGLNEPGEVQSLAAALMNPLQNELKVLEKSKVSPSLGEAIVKQGVSAGILGLSLTAMFMLLYYRVAGIIAILGLAVNTIILFGFMAMFGFTFSLPGIAAIILNIGMAVDANVLIYERLREEIAAGKSLKSAIEAAYDKAFSAIFDSNITSLITAAILFSMASGAVKGFAVTLVIGIVGSVFSALLVTRVCFRWGVDLKILKGKLTFYNLIKPTNFDFLSKTRLAVMCSGFLLLVTVGSFGIRQDRALGVDFTGGTLIKFELGPDSKLTQGEVDNALATIAGELRSTPFPQISRAPGASTVLSIRCASMDREKGVRDPALIVETLRKTLPGFDEKAQANTTNIIFDVGRNPLDSEDVQKVLDGLKGQLSGQGELTLSRVGTQSDGITLTINSPIGPEADQDNELIVAKLTEAVPVLKGRVPKIEAFQPYIIQESQDTVSALIGGAYLWESLIALGLGLIGILIYITVRFEFSFALAGFVAILHDVFISIGLVVAIGRELSLIHVGAILAIAGYSINDTIVVFDRVRESLFHRSGSVRDLMNEAINATLSRTLLTSMTTIVTVAILSVFGGSALRDFSLIIFFGLVVGTYSSIFVASPIVLWWSSRKGGDLRQDVVTSELEKEILAMEKH